MAVVHKCRFLPWMPDAVEALAFPPPSIASSYPLLACLRSSGDIEIYDGRAGWVSRRIPTGGAIAQHVQSIAFLSSFTSSAAPILLTVGLDGMVVEWDVSFLRPIRMRIIEGGGIWGMALSMDEKYLAIASEDGNVRILDVQLKGKKEEKRSFKVVRVLKVLEEAIKDGKIVSLAWSTQSPGMLAAGSSLGNIIIWKVFDEKDNLKNSTILHRINVGSVKLAEKKKFVDPKKARYFKTEEDSPLVKQDIIVWSLQFVGNTLVCGDSRGLVTYFDPLLGVAAGQSSLHKGPVMSIASNPADPLHFFSCGADGMIQGYVNSANKSSVRLSKKDWKSIHHRYPHTHDIRSSIYVKLPEGKDILPASHLYRDAWVMISGGVDGDISIWRVDSKTSQEPERLSSIPHQPLLKVVPKTSMIVAADMRIVEENANEDTPLNEAPKSIKIWTLGEPDKEYEAFSRAIKSLDIHETPVVSPPRLALEMKVPKEDESISSLDVNDDGNLLALITRNRVSVYSLEIVKRTHADNNTSKKRRRVLDPIESVKVEKLEIPSGIFEETIPQFLRFLKETNVLLTCTVIDGMKVNIQAFELPSFKLKWEHTSDLLQTAVSFIQSSSKCLVVVDYEGNIIFLNPSNGQLMKHAKAEFPIQAICLIPSEESPTLIAATSNYVIHQFSPLTDDPEDFHIQIDNLPHAYTRRFEPIVGISFVPGTENLPNLRLYSQRNIFILDLSKPIPTATQERTLYPKEVHLCRSIQPTFPETPEGQALRKIFAENMYKVEKSQDGRIMCLQYLRDQEAVWIERSWNDVVSLLPPAIMRKRFGRS